MIVQISVRFPDHISNKEDRLETCRRQIRNLEKAIVSAPEEDKVSLMDSLSLVRAVLNEATDGELAKMEVPK